jgi:hypothetical protein
LPLPSHEQVSLLLRAWASGDEAALEKLTPIIYEELRRLARYYMSRERESASIASKEPESELVCGTLGEIGQRRMSVEVDPVWRIFAHQHSASHRILFFL